MGQQDKSERITNRISVAYPDVFTGTQVHVKVDAPSNQVWTVGTPGEEYRYHFKVGNRIVHRGSTSDLVKREKVHRNKYPSGHIVNLGKVRA